MKTKDVCAEARKLAYYRRNEGGVIITLEYTGKDDINGVHWRALIDGGHKRNGRIEWMAARKHGGGYDVRGEVLALAIAGITQTEPDFFTEESAKKAARDAGWVIYEYYTANVYILIPGEAVAKQIAAEIEAATDTTHKEKNHERD